MTTSEYILNFALLAYILFANLGTKELTKGRVWRPLLIAAGVACAFRSDFPAAGHDVALEFAGLIAGVALGVASALFVHVSRLADERLVTTAGAGFAAVWIAAVGGRMLFAYGANHWFTHALVTFSRTHQITGSAAWAGTFVLMALAMVVTRVLVTSMQAARLTPTDVAVLAA